MISWRACSVTWLAIMIMYVVCHYGKLHHQFVGVKFSGRQTLQIHVCFYFAMELSAFPMRMVQAYNIMVVQSQVCPPGVDFNVVGKQELAVLVNRPADDFIPCADGGRCFCVFVLSKGVTSISTGT